MDLELTARNSPRLRRNIPDTEFSLCELKLHSLLLVASFDKYFFKATEDLGRFTSGLGEGEVELDDFGTVDMTSVLHLQLGIDLIFLALDLNT